MEKIEKTFSTRNLPGQKDVPPDQSVIDRLPVSDDLGNGDPTLGEFSGNPPLFSK
jgi:hypothetical protein